MFDSLQGSNMQYNANAHRGRPVGSGIDDRDRLNDLVAIMAANPGMKATSAIRKLGVTNPSMVRRLRDKLKAEQNDASSAPPAPSPEPARPHHHTAAADSAHQFKISEAVPPRTRTLRHDPPPTLESQKLDQPLIGLIELSIGTWTAALAAQQAMISMMFKSPAIRAVIHQHITVSEAAMTFLRVPASPRWAT